MDMEQKIKRLPFGRKVRVGNYEVVKVTKGLGRKELAELRAQAGIPDDVRKHLQRGSLPYIMVQTIGGSWSVFFSCGLTVYEVLDTMLPQALDPQDGHDGMTLDDFAHLINMWHLDTTAYGDKAYHQDKARALKAYMDRVSASKEETPEQKEADDEVLDGVRKDMEAADTAMEMAESLGVMNGDPSVMAEKGGGV